MGKPLTVFPTMCDYPPRNKSHSFVRLYDRRRGLRQFRWMSSVIVIGRHRLSLFFFPRGSEGAEPLADGSTGVPLNPYIPGGWDGEAAQRNMGRSGGGGTL